LTDDSRGFFEPSERMGATEIEGKKKKGAKAETAKEETLFRFRRQGVVMCGSDETRIFTIWEKYSKTKKKNQHGFIGGEGRHSLSGKG